VGARARACPSVMAAEVVLTIDVFAWRQALIVKGLYVLQWRDYCEHRVFSVCLWSGRMRCVCMFGFN